MGPLRDCHSRLFIFIIFCVVCLIQVSGLECHSCTAFGLAGSNLNEACINFDKNQIGTQPCNVGEGQVGRCVVFKGSVTIDPPLFDAQTGSGTLRYCEVYAANEAPANGCYAATEIPSSFLSGVFTVASFLGADEVIQGKSCYCSTDRCNAATTVVFSYVNMIVLLILSIMYCAEGVRSYFL